MQPKVAPKVKSATASKPNKHAGPPPDVIYEPGSNEQYYPGQLLGKGGFALCYEGRLARSNKLLALKVVPRKLDSAKMEAKVRASQNEHWCRC